MGIILVFLSMPTQRSDNNGSIYSCFFYQSHKDLVAVWVHVLVFLHSTRLGLGDLRRVHTGISLVNQVVDVSLLPLSEEMPDGGTYILHVYSVHVKLLRPQHLQLLLRVSVNSTNQQTWCDALSVARTIHDGWSQDGVV